MNVIPTHIPDVLILEPTIFHDERGYFYESYNQKTFQQATGLNVTFVQENVSRSKKNVLRGLHYQIEQPQGKLIRVTHGAVFDVAVDIRQGSATYGQWTGTELSAENQRQLWIPAGFAHGFLVLSDYADCLYKVTDFYLPSAERCIAWNDAEIGVEWPLMGEPLLSAKDR